MEAVIIGVGLGALYGFLYYANSKTPQPEGCSQVSGGCHTCGDTSCHQNDSEGV